MLRKILRKSQPNFEHYVKKTEAQTKKNGCFKKQNKISYIKQACSYLIITTMCKLISPFTFF